MSINTTTFRFRPWNSAANYQTDDVVNTDSGGTYQAYFYATQPNVNQAPFNAWSLSVGDWARQRGIVTLNTTSTITTPLAKGSCIEVVGAGSLNFTGCALDGGSNWIKYPCAGPDGSGTTVATLQSSLNPAWSTGFGWVPSYSTDISTNLLKTDTQFGDGYSQRVRVGITPSLTTQNLVFENISSRQAVAICNYIQDKGGVDPVKINMEDGILHGGNNNQYKILDAKIASKSLDINTVTAQAVQVFSAAADS